jgi:hypothetical protein
MDSSHFELAREGVPMIYPSSGYDDREKGVGYGLEKANEYTSDRYHRVTNEYNLSWDVGGALEDMEMFFKVGLDVANSDAWPNWKEGSEFEQKRDERRAGSCGWLQKWLIARFVGPELVAQFQGVGEHPGSRIPNLFATQGRE